MTRPKLLLADDSVTIRKVVELTFADEGVDVTTVADGDSAMSKFVEGHPDIVLVDVGLPEMNGYDFCEMIKTDESTSHIPVVLLVGSFEPFDQDAAAKSGADGFLTKPFHSIRDLVNRVHELLGTQGEASSGEVIDFETTISEGEAGDDDDIDELYERSFSDTVAIDNFETVPSLTADDKPSDSMTQVEGQSADEKLPEEAAQQESSEESVTEGRAEEEPSEEAPSEHSAESQSDVPVPEITPDAEIVDASHHSVDEWLDDEMIETVSSASPGEFKTAESEAVAAVGLYEDAPAAAVDIEPIKEFDWSPAAIVTASDEREMGAAAGFNGEGSMISTAASIEGHITEELPDLKTDQMPELTIERAQPVDDSTSAGSGLDIPPVSDVAPELIELITQRVIERLSDRAVREVAQEAVPRIAEKLMREALEEDRNK